MDQAVLTRQVGLENSLFAISLYGPTARIVYILVLTARNKE